MFFARPSVPAQEQAAVVQSQPPEASQIPSSVWLSDRAFGNEVQMIIPFLPLVQQSKETLTDQIHSGTLSSAMLFPSGLENPFSHFSDRVKLCGWLAIVYYHPTLSHLLLEKLTAQLGMSLHLSLQAAAIWGNRDYFSFLLERSYDALQMSHPPQLLQDALIAEGGLVFQLAAERGHVQVLKHIEAMIPRRSILIDMILLHKGKAFVSAAAKGWGEMVDYFIEYVTAHGHDGDIANLFAAGEGGEEYAAFSWAMRNQCFDTLEYMLRCVGEKSPNQLGAALKVLTSERKDNMRVLDLATAVALDPTWSSASSEKLQAWVRQEKAAQRAGQQASVFSEMARNAERVMQAVQAREAANGPSELAPQEDDLPLHQPYPLTH